jgi:hypothetical protein
MDDGKGGDFMSLIGFEENYLKLWFIVEGNLTKGTIYRFRYRTLNSVGWSLFSDTGFIQAANVPQKPPVPVYVSSVSTSITMKFQQTADDGGTPVIGYKIFRDAGNDFTSSYVQMTSYDGMSSTFTATVASDGLVSGRIYRFVYVATNSLGDSEYSNELISGVGAPPDKPNAPHKDVELSNETSTFIYWDRIYTSDVPMSGYMLYVDDGLTGVYNLVYDGSLNPAQVTYRVNDLVPGRTYRFKVRAVDYNGQGYESNSISYLSCMPPSGVKQPRLE